jgi:hypothetical protein
MKRSHTRILIAIGSMPVLVVLWFVVMANGLPSSRDFVYIQIRDSQTHEVPVKASFAYTFESWTLGDLVKPWPHRVTVGGSGPFQDNEGLLMPEIGDPVEVIVWTDNHREVRCSFVAPTEAHHLTQWAAGEPPVLEYRVELRPYAR